MLKFIPFVLLLTGCSYSINMIHSKGSGTDMIDENQTTSPDIAPVVNIPLK